MAAPLTNAQFAGILKRLKLKGFSVKEVSDWRTNNRNHKGKFGPINIALGVHHTGSNADSVSYITGFIAHYGQGAEVPGPLCNWFIRRNGEIWLVSSGRTNHFGKISQASLDLARKGLAGVAEIKPGADSVDGNAVSYGVEVAGDGGADDYTPAQTKAVIALGAEMCRALGWDSPDCLAHKEVTRRKPGDPVMDMGWYRRQVAAELAAPSGASAAAPAAPQNSNPVTKGWDEVATKDEVKAAVTEAMQTVLWTPVIDAKKDSIPGLLNSSWRNNMIYLQGKLDRIITLITALNPVDEAELAAKLGEVLAPIIAPAVEQAVKAGGEPEAIAKATLELVAAKLAAPDPDEAGTVSS